MTDPRKGLIGIGGALLSIPIYFLWRKPKRHVLSTED
jgi:hypothetical protein